MLDVERRQKRELSEREWDVLLRDLVEQQREAEASRRDPGLEAVLEELRILRRELSQLRADVASLGKAAGAR